jgi:hypothetical protein
MDVLSWRYNKYKALLINDFKKIPLNFSVLGCLKSISKKHKSGYTTLKLSHAAGLVRVVSCSKTADPWREELVWLNDDPGTRGGQDLGKFLHVSHQHRRVRVRLAPTHGGKKLDQ